MATHRRRTARSAALVGLVVVGALVAGGVGFGIALAARNGVAQQRESLTAETARAGQCVDLTEDAGFIGLLEADCDAPHDAEIVLTTELGEAYDEPGALEDAEAVCRGLLDPDEVDRLDGQAPGLDWGLLIDDARNIDSFDRLVCYVRDPDTRLDGPLLADR
jgi:hypothetical protein